MGRKVNVMLWESEQNEYFTNGTPAELNTPVLLLFFNRPAQFSKVFEAVKRVKPCELFLYQDGPRKGKNDEKGINACREIVSGIDWTCKIHTWYRNENCGCDPSEYLSQKWAFSHAEMCIVLEDDDVPNISFFYFCQEMLIKYQNDERIAIISGMNHLGKYRENENDYLFTTLCSIWGWASWRRVIDEWDDQYDFLNDNYTIKNLMRRNSNTQIAEVLGASRKHKKKGIAYYESILATNVFLHNRLNIVPSVNLISNIGIAPTSTHSTDSIKKLPHGIRRVFNMETYEMCFPVKEPEYMVEDMIYQKKVKRIFAWGHPVVKLYRKIERVFLMALYSIIPTEREEQ